MRLHLRNRARILVPVVVAITVAVAAYTAAVAPATPATIGNVAGGRWSDPTIWVGSRVPSDGDLVEIAVNTEVLYDLESEAEIGGIEINGTLRFSRERSTNLDVGTVKINAGGHLEIGTPEAPIPASVTSTIRIVNEEDGENSIDAHGTVNIHGQPMEFVYTRLAADADKGARQITVNDDVDWRAGDYIVIASTTQNPGETEANYIKAIEGNIITLRRPLKHSHSGESTTRAEVANLTRNVIITSKNPKLRGHMRILSGAQAFISYAEFAKLGAFNQMGKYPIHFHMVGDTVSGGYVKGASIWDSRNRFITVHSTQFVTMEDNVGYKAVGHGFFMEIGDEVFVTWKNNIGMLVRPGKLTKDDAHPAVFWIQNPHNTYVGNIAVSSKAGSGFEFSIPSGIMDMTPLEGLTKPRGLSILEFEGNVAHSNFDSGLKTYVLNGLDNGETSRFDNLKLWRNGRIGASIRGNRAAIKDSIVFGNGEINVVLKGDGNAIENSHILGELEGVSVEGDADISPAPRGVFVWGEGNSIVDSVIGGHIPNETGGGIDAGIFQDEFRVTNLTIRNSELGSERTVVLGHLYWLQTSVTYVYKDFCNIRFNSCQASAPS